MPSVAVLIQYLLVTDRWTDGRTHGLRSLLPRTAPERSRLVSSRPFSTSERFASRSLTPDETSPSALTLLRPKRATKRRIATPTCLLFCAAMENSDEMYVFAVFCTYLVTFMKIVTDNSLSC